jgi:hypothetical protein
MEIDNGPPSSAPSMPSARSLTNDALEFAQIRSKLESSAQRRRARTARIAQRTANERDGDEDPDAASNGTPNTWMGTWRQLSSALAQTGPSSDTTMSSSSTGAPSKDQLPFVPIPTVDNDIPSEALCQYIMRTASNVHRDKDTALSLHILCSCLTFRFSIVRWSSIN